MLSLAIIIIYRSLLGVAVEHDASVHLHSGPYCEALSALCSPFDLAPLHNAQRLCRPLWQRSAAVLAVPRGKYPFASEQASPRRRIRLSISVAFVTQPF